MALLDLVMPKLGESIMEATVLKWHKKPGDVIKQDETLLDIATDKVDTEVPSTAAGTIKEILFNVNDVVPVGAVIARIETEVGVEPQDVDNAPSVEPQEPDGVPSAEPDRAPAVEPDFALAEEVPYVPRQKHVVASSINGNRFYSPLVLNIANSEGIS